MLVQDIMRIREAYAEERKPYRPRPSAAGPERCIRSMVYHRLDYPASPLPGRSLVVMDDSSFHEELTLDLLRKSGALRIHSEQMEVECRAPMTTGSIDFIIQTIDGRDVLTEHKALNHFTAEGFFAKDVLPLDYFAQMSIYAEAICRMTGKDALPCLLLVKNKNTSAYVEFVCVYFMADDRLHVAEKVRSDGRHVTIDTDFPGIVTAACEKFDAVERYALAGTIPERQYTERNEYPCSYCQYHGECWRGWEQELDVLVQDGDLTGMQEQIEFYAQLKAEAASAEKEAIKLQPAIKAAMKAAGIGSGRAGNYWIQLRTQQRKELDRDLIPEDMKRALTVVKTIEVLTVRNMTNARKGKEED